MGCCLFSCIGAAWPRLALVFLYFFTPIIDRGFVTWYWPLAGFFFLPTTTLVYAMIRGHYDLAVDANIWTLLVMIVAFLHDLGQLGMAKRKRAAKN